MGWFTPSDRGATFGMLQCLKTLSRPGARRTFDHVMVTRDTASFAGVSGSGVVDLSNVRGPVNEFFKVPFPWLWQFVSVPTRWLVTAIFHIYTHSSVCRLPPVHQAASAAGVHCSHRCRKRRSLDPTRTAAQLEYLHSQLSRLNAWLQGTCVSGQSGFHRLGLVRC